MRHRLVETYVLSKVGEPPKLPRARRHCSDAVQQQHDVDTLAYEAAASAARLKIDETGELASWLEFRLHEERVSATVSAPV